jgi:hypothetical protein
VSDEQDGEGEFKLTQEEALVLIGKHQDSLVKARFKIETERDRALLLITGGALTVSFAYVPTLVDKGYVVALWALIAAWLVWVVTLVWGLLGHTVSVRVYTEQINKLAGAQWLGAQKEPWLAKHIELLNKLGISLLVLGFMFFGYFAISNLERVTNGEQKELTPPSRLGSRRDGSPSGKEVSPVAKEPNEGAASQRALPPSTASEAPRPPKKEVPR